MWMRQGAAMGIEKPKGNDSNNVNGAVEDVPSDDELNDSDPNRDGASKGVGGDDDNGTQEAVALDKAGILDLDDSEQAAKAGTYVEVTKVAADVLADKEQVDLVAGRRPIEGSSQSEEFLTNLVGNLDSVVDITETAESVGAKDSSTLIAVVNNAEKAEDLKVVIQAADEVGSKDSSTLGAVLRNAESADKVASVVRKSTDEVPGQAAEESSSNKEKKSKKLLGMFKAVKRSMRLHRKRKLPLPKPPLLKLRHLPRLKLHKLLQKQRLLPKPQLPKPPLPKPLLPN